jgi:hypothetical protein
MTKAQIGMILADYDAASRDFRKAAKRVDELKAQIRLMTLKQGIYGEMTYAEGTPREILDQAAAKTALITAGLPVPMIMTQAPIIAKPTVK